MFSPAFPSKRLRCVVFRHEHTNKYTRTRVSPTYFIGKFSLALPYYQHKFELELCLMEREYLSLVKFQRRYGCFEFRPIAIYQLKDKRKRGKIVYAVNE